MIAVGSLESSFRTQGRRITLQRALLFRLIEDLQEEHPTAEALYVRAAREMPSLSLRTVYATLKELEDINAVRSLDVGTGSMRICVNPWRHHHIVCIQCGKTQDVSVDVGPVEIPADQRRGFVLKGHDIVFRGICAGCRR